MAAAIAVLATTCGLAIAAVKPSPKGLGETAIDVRATPIESFDRTGNGATRFGRLEWRGGLILSADTPHFGGWSGLAVSADGRQMTAVSDAGAWMTAAIGYTGNRLQTVTGVKIGALKARNGKDLARGRDRDAEGLSLISGSLTAGEALISFENHHRIGRFPLKSGVPGAPSRYLELAREMKKKSGRDGLETVAVISGGALKGAVLAIAEYPASKAATHSAWLWQGDRPEKLAIQSRDEFAITDATGLPDGSLLILERRFRMLEGVRMRLRLVEAAEIRPGATLDGEILLEADLTSEIDNMEALAVHQSPAGETILTLLSDDNFSRFLQRTVVLQFALDPRPAN